MSTLSRRAGRPLRALTLLALTASLTMTPGATQVAAAASAVPDPGRNSEAVTAWGQHHNVAPSTVSGFLKQGYRIVDLEVRSSSPRFDVSYVKNSGAQARDWWWYFHQTPTQIAEKLETHAARLIDIEPYDTAKGTRYAVVMVRNTGAAAKSWGWHYDVPLSTITNYAKRAGMRVVDVERMPGNSNRFAAIYIKNTGVDAKDWWHAYNVTFDEVADLVAETKGRILNLERNANGRYDVVLQQSTGEYWWWLAGATATEVGEAANQFGARIYQVKGYQVDGKTRYDALFLGNTDDETRRVANAAGDMAGKWGFYLKEVGGGDKVGIGQDNVFEPASMIKIVHAVTAMREIQNTPTTSATPIAWNALPSDPARYPGQAGYGDDKNKCAYDGNGNLLTNVSYADALGPVILAQTLQNSDNRTTDALTRRYGFGGLNATIAAAGMTNSAVNHRIGCAAAASPQPLTHNDLTLRDAGRIYEGVADTTLLDAAHRDELYGYLSGGPVGGALASMIAAEAAAAGLTATETQEFFDRVVTRSKPGGYDYCPSWGGSGDCNPDVVSTRTVGGTIWLPFKGGRLGQVTDRAYVYGQYFQATFDCTFAQVNNGTCADLNQQNAGQATVAVEMFRAEVKKALATW